MRTAAILHDSMQAAAIYTYMRTTAIQYSFMRVAAIQYSYMRTAATNSLPGIRQGPSTWRPCAQPHQNQQCGDNGRKCPPTGLLLQNKLFKMPGCGAVNPELRARIRI
jgi:hypothetical protein